jgi:Holliday junction DNA helicase RuvA
MSVDAFLLCIEAQDADSLVRIPGVGRKTAERLLIEMKDRIKNLGALPGVSSGAAVLELPIGAHAEAYSALTALGYKPAEVTRLLKAVDPSIHTTEEVIRRALQAAAAK